MIDGNKDHSISLLREQRYLWSAEVEQMLVPARFPTCQRRVAIEPDSKNFTEMKLYQNDTYLFVAQQGTHWWAIGTEACQVQTFKTPPADPGDLIGSFQRKDGELKFVSLPPQAVAK
jgi:hypothetical protein